MSRSHVTAQRKYVDFLLTLQIGLVCTSLNLKPLYVLLEHFIFSDVIHRLQPLIIELERMTQSCLIITHRVVMRILLGYLLDWSHDEMPHMHVPLHS